MKHLLIILLSLSFLSACTESKIKELESLCHEAIKDRLKSPATYEMVETTNISREITIEEYLELQNENRRKSDKLKTKSDYPYIKDKAYQFGFVIKYDAANSYGTPIRGLSRCQYLSSSDELDNIMQSSILVDGKTNLTRLLEQVDSLK